jgi:pimeloyl-ACP methyl ester carboxylesterase
MSLQLADLRAVLDAERVERVALLGCSFGVQLALEAYRELGERVGCMVLMSGAPGRPIDVLARSQTTGAALRRALDWARRKNGNLDRRIPRALLKPLMTRLVGPPAAAELREELIEAIAGSELSPLVGTLDGYARHDAWGLVDEVRAPTLIVAGTHDPLAPPAIMQRLARHIPHSEVLVVRGAHHFSFAEYPDLVNLRLERFFEDVGWC